MTSATLAELQAPLSVWSPRGWRFAVTPAALGCLGRLSTGFRERGAQPRPAIRDAANLIAAGHRCGPVLVDLACSGAWPVLAALAELARDCIHQSDRGATLMTSYTIKPDFQTMLRPGVRALARLGVTANAVTLAAAGLSAASGAGIVASSGADWSLLLVPPVLLARMALNAADGMLAREHGGASALGAVLNEVCDVLSDAALYLPMAFLMHPGWPIVAAVVAGLIAEVAGLAPVLAGAARRYDGPFGKPDRALLFGAAAILQVAFGLTSITVMVVFGLATAAGMLTATRRIASVVS